MALANRLAKAEDRPALMVLMELAISELQKGLLSPAEIEASHAIMGIDTQLIADGTYFIVEADGALVGCGGWSRRATLYGGDHSERRDAALLDPARNAARVRAMYTHPDFTRRGVGRLILDLSERAAAAEGFTRVELMATLSGAQLYRACGYGDEEPVIDHTPSGVAVPLVRMSKRIASA